MQTAAQVTHRARAKTYDKFLETFQDTGNVTASCMVAGIDRRSIYRRKKSDAEFAELFDIALEISVDKLEYVARNRALDGVKEPVYYKGDIVGHVYKPSDRLMELLLKAHRPDKFNPVQKLEHSGGVSVSVVQFGADNIQDNQAVTVESTAQRVEEAEENQALSSSLPEDERGGHFAGGTPKSVLAENDEPPHVVKFAD